MSCPDTLAAERGVRAILCADVARAQLTRQRVGRRGGDVRGPVAARHRDRTGRGGDGTHPARSRGAPARRTWTSPASARSGGRGLPPREKARERTGPARLVGGPAADDGRLGGPPAALARGPWASCASRPAACPDAREGPRLPGRSPSISLAVGGGSGSPISPLVSGPRPGWSERLRRRGCAHEIEVRDEATRIMARVRVPGRPRRDLVRTGASDNQTRDQALEEAARRCATAEAVEARVLAHATDWTELRFDELVLSTREAANEACSARAATTASTPLDLAARAGLPLAQRLLTSRLAPSRDGHAARRRCARPTFRAGRARREVGRALAARTAPAVPRGRGDARGGSSRTARRGSRPSRAGH